MARIIDDMIDEACVMLGSDVVEGSVIKCIRTRESATVSGSAGQLFAVNKAQLTKMGASFSQAFPPRPVFTEKNLPDLTGKVRLPHRQCIPPLRQGSN